MANGRSNCNIDLPDGLMKKLIDTSEAVGKDLNGLIELMLQTCADSLPSGLDGMTFEEIEASAVEATDSLDWIEVGLQKV